MQLIPSIGVQLALSAMLCVSVAAAAPQAAPPSAPPATQPQQNAAQEFDTLPWPVKLGLRSQIVTAAVPLLDRVVLVPDAATYLDELRRWSPQGRWPVLIEDDHLAPMFVRRFNPAQLLRRRSVLAPGAAFQPTHADLNAIIVHAFGGDAQKQSVRDAFEAQRYVPPGVVVTSLSDPAWTAAVALAAGRGQPIAVLDEPFGQPNDELNHETAMRLAAAIEACIAQQNYGYQQLGDAIDTITICRSMAIKAHVTLPADIAPPVGGPHGEGPVAVTDLIGRNADGTRFAIAGWIFGDEVRSAYIAMCSMFLPRDSAALWHTYPPGQPWDMYSANSAADLFTQGGFDVQHMTGVAADERAWLRSLQGGMSRDLLLMNTKGNSDFFDLSSGLAYPTDVPVLNQPLSLHLIHSWSMQRLAPLDEGPNASSDTVGGQWLEHGVYAMAGSCHEPYLSAFVPPSEIANRLMHGVPFLVAARWWDGQGPLSRPWRVVTFGDPLMMCVPPSKWTLTRQVPTSPHCPHDNPCCVDLNAHVRELMRQAEHDDNGNSFAHALHILNMLGKDEVAVGLWRVADGRGTAANAARAALPAIFRAQDADQFMRAWEHLPRRDAMAVDMLWHLMLPRAGSASGDTLLQLQSALRPPRPDRDLARLAPHLQRTFGKLHVQSLIQRQMERTTASASRDALADLLKHYR